MDGIALANLVAYCAQVLCLTAAAGLLLAVLRVDLPAARYVCLRLTLALCLVLPWLQSRQMASRSSETITTFTTAIPADAPAVPPSAGNAAIAHTQIVPLILGAGATARVCWLVIGFLRLRRRRSEGHCAPPGEYAQLQQSIGTNADVRYLAAVNQPVTFGVWRPVVLLPAALRSQPSDIREAVVAHELVHIRRRDWAWVIAEEFTRSAFWFHPAMWWLISRIQLAREEVVDALAVSHTGRRRAYVQALLTFADGVPLAPAPAFARRRHLYRRMVLVSREDVMTSTRLVVSAAAMLAIMAIGGWYAAAAFPLLAPQAGQVLQREPGPLERAANPISPQNPVPRRLQHEPPEYPREAAAADAWVSLTMRLTIDSAGIVAESRVTALSLKTEGTSLSIRDPDAMRKLDQVLDDLTIRTRPGAAAEPASFRARPIIDAAINAAAIAVERWRYDAPINPPVSLDTTFYFAPTSPVVDTPASTRMDDRNDGLRVGGNVKMPKKIKHTPPIYPVDAKEAGIQGVVILEVRIDPEGRVSDARVLRSIPMLDQAAVDAVRQWEFEPTLLNGVPTPVIMTVTVQFTLA